MNFNASSPSKETVVSSFSNVDELLAGVVHYVDFLNHHGAGRKPVASIPSVTSCRWLENSNTPLKPCPLSLGKLTPTRVATSTWLRTSQCLAVQSVWFRFLLGSKGALE